MFSDFPCVLDSSSARTQETDVQNNCRSTALPESILHYLLTIAQKQFRETFPFLETKIFPCITRIKVYYYSLLGLSKAEPQHRASIPGALKLCHGFPIQKGHISLHFYSSDYHLCCAKPLCMILCVSHNSCFKYSTVYASPGTLLASCWRREKVGVCLQTDLAQIPQHPSSLAPNSQYCSE